MPTPKTDHELTFDGGKYTVKYTDGPNGIQVQEALRHGEKWRDLVGDNLVRHLVIEVHDSHSIQRDQEDHIIRLQKQINALLEHCPDAECSECSKVICPHGDDMHFHHDGCPSCVQAAESVLAAASPNEPK